MFLQLRIAARRSVSTPSNMGTARTGVTGRAGPLVVAADTALDGFALTGVEQVGKRSGKRTNTRLDRARMDRFGLRRGARFVLRGIAPLESVPAPSGTTVPTLATPGTAALRPRFASPVSARAAHGALKRTVDIVGAGAGLVLLSPLLASIALAVRFGPEGGSVLFGHTRIGCNGRPFRCWKFRTMVENGDEVLRRHLATNPAAQREWAETFKLRDDPRVTRLGHVMRKLSIDELPQLLNVVRGEMSLVGPRPVVASELDRYGRSAAHYLRSRPGLTGLWQVSGRNDVDYRRRVAFDRWYAANASLAMDAVILVRTVPVVCFARGSY